MTTNLYTVTIVDTDGCGSTTTIHPTIEAAEQHLRGRFDPADGFADLDLLDFLRKIEEVHWMIASITCHPYPGTGPTN